jgi:diguanylate cyclase (GGDEF)-like protein
MWFCGDGGAYRYEAKAPTPAFAQPAPLLRHIAGEHGSTASTLPFAFRRLRIEFAPVSYRPGTTYQYRLDPVDATWSAWTPETFVDFTNLTEGSYTLHVRAQGAGGMVSPEATWAFTVLPPWYRATWAIVLWLVAAAVIVVLIVRLRTSALRRQAERLRTSIAERTEELRATVDLLETANSQLERLSLLDELTGIANRRYFQRILAEDWERCRTEQQPLSLILIDLDHFKELNDTHGHPAGDACLRAIGRFLAQRIRRSGDLATRTGDMVARYGGEEFAVLLASANEAEADTLAESIRSGIERLPIAFGDQTFSITASCGLASIVPTADDTPSSLIDRADRALYAAKHDGRNCVRSAVREVGAATWMR